MDGEREDQVTKDQRKHKRGTTAIGQHVSTTRPI